MNIEIKKALKKDAAEILNLQKLVFKEGFEVYDHCTHPPLKETIKELTEEYDRKTFFKAVHNGKIIGSIRAYREDDICFPEKLFIHPDYQNHGLGTKMMKVVEDYYTDKISRFRLSTDKNSKKNIYLYQKLGYKIYKTKIIHDNEGFVYMEKHSI